MHVKLPLLIVNQTVNLCCTYLKVNKIPAILIESLKFMFSCIPKTIIIIFIIVASRALGEAQAKLPEIPAHLQACQD